jgi:hypothetical protein
MYIEMNPVGPTTFTCTLFERSTLTQSYYTWKFVNKETNQTYLYYTNDTSSFPQYYNKFTFTNSFTMSGATAGITNLPAGFYNYTVYEMVNPYDLNINNAVDVVERYLVSIQATYSTSANTFVSMTQSQSLFISF